MTPIPSEQRERLSTLMEDRRLALGLSWREVAQRADLAYETVRALRTGDGGVQSLTAANLDRALQWQTGSVERILAGGDPLPMERAEDGGPRWASLTPRERQLALAFIEFMRQRGAEREDNGEKNSA